MNEIEDEIFQRESILHMYNFPIYNLEKYREMQVKYDNLVEMTRKVPDPRNVDSLLRMKDRIESEKQYMTDIMERIKEYPVPHHDIVHPLENGGYILMYKGRFVPFNWTYKKTILKLQEKRDEMKQREREIKISSILSSAGYPPF